MLCAYVHTSSPALRLGLQHLLSERGICLAETPAAADVLVVEADADEESFGDLPPSKPVVWLLRGAEGLPRVPLANVSGWAVLELSASAEALAAAVQAVAAGLVVLSPEVHARFPALPRPLPERAVGLSSRERQILELVSAGLTSKAIGARLGIAESTVKFHLANAYAKLGVESRAQAVHKAAQLGLIAL